MKNLKSIVAVSLFAQRQLLCSVLRPRQHSIGYMGDGFYRSKDPANSIKAVKENLQRKNQKTQTTKYTYTVWVKKIPPRGPDITHFPHKRLRIFNRFFTHLSYVPIYARLQIFIQLSPTLTKLCHIKRDYAVHIICAKCLKRARSDVCVSRW